MPDDIATKTSRVRMALVALAGTSAVLYVLWTTLQLMNMSSLLSEVEVLRTTVTALKQRREVEAEANARRIDNLERVLFGDIVEKIQPPPPVVNIPKWMEQRNLELQERITTLERWRLVAEKELRDIRKGKD